MLVKGHVFVVEAALGGPFVFHTDPISKDGKVLDCYT